VIVTPLIDTVGSVGAPSVPIVSTGPPPLITVAAAAAPRRVSDFGIAIPPAKVPGPTVTVAPSGAASTAAWIEL
jgi:hypothetical protein